MRGLPVTKRGLPGIFSKLPARDSELPASRDNCPAFRLLRPGRLLFKTVSPSAGRKRSHQVLAPVKNFQALQKMSLKARDDAYDAFKILIPNTLFKKIFLKERKRRRNLRILAAQKNMRIINFLISKLIYIVISISIIVYKYYYCSVLPSPQDVPFYLLNIIIMTTVARRSASNSAPSLIGSYRKAPAPSEPLLGTHSLSVIHS